jgi:hypothetical protein
MTGHGEKLTRKQEQAISALLLHPTLAKAAEACGVSEKTLWRWLQCPEFQQAYRQARREAVSQAIARLQRITAKAVDTLEGVMADAEAPAPAKVTACRVVLEVAVKAVELDDLQSRIEELERNLSNGKPTPANK